MKYLAQRSTVLQLLTEEERKERQDKVLAVRAVMGGSKSIPTADGGSCALMRNTANEYILLIPASVRRLNTATDRRFSDELRMYGQSGSTLKIKGGKNLVSVRDMFLNMKQFSTIDLSEMETKKLKDMQGMFAGCQADNIIFGKLHTGEVVRMSFMFNDANIKNISLAGLNLNKVKTMSCMFEDCWADSIDMGSSSTEALSDTSDMFAGCSATLVDMHAVRINNPVRGKLKSTFSGSALLNEGSKCIVNDTVLKGFLTLDRKIQNQGSEEDRWKYEEYLNEMKEDYKRFASGQWTKWF